MQSFNVTLTKHYLYYQSSDLSLDGTLQENVLEATDQISQLSDLFAKLELPKGTNIYITLDRFYIDYFCFNLPLLNRKKLDKILHYELADVLIRDIDLYYFDYRTTNFKNTETLTGVYVIKKELVTRLVQLCKINSLELRAIFSLNDLLDLKIREGLSPLNELVVIADRYVVNLLIYKNGFLVGFSKQEIPKQLANSSNLSNDQTNGHLLDDLNWRIKAIALKEHGISSIRLSDEVGGFLKANEQKELSLSIDDKNGIPAAMCSDLVQSSQYARTNRINLLKSNLFVLQELKKQIKKLVLLSITFSIGLLLYITTQVYQYSVSMIRYQKLERQFSESVLNYLPKGNSTANALQILRDQVDGLKKIKLQNQKYGKREYEITQQLNAISQLKQQVPSLLVTRYFMTDQSIRIEGRVASFTAYDKVKSGFELIYSERNTLKFNQNSVGEDTVEFSISIRPNQQ